MNMKKIVGVILILLGCIGALYLLAPYVRPDFAAPPTSTGVEVTVTQVFENASAYTIDAEYPQVGIPEIDVQLTQTVQDTLAQFKALPQNPHGSATPQNQFTGRFDRVYVGPDVVSTELIFEQYTGGAHPNTAFSGVNFDRTSGKLLTLDDALKMTGLTLDQLSAQATAELKTRLADSFMFPEGVSADPQNFSSFVVGTSSVTFLLQQYQVAPYVFGEQELSFPKK